MKKLITILLLILFFFTSNVSYSRKTRSDGGFSYKVGSISSLNPQYSEDYKKISDGKLFLTSKRIIFLGSSENKSVNINSLLDIDVYYDSIVLGKSTGKKPLIKFYLDDAAVFSRILSRIF